MGHFVQKVLQRRSEEAGDLDFLSLRSTPLQTLGAGLKFPCSSSRRFGAQAGLTAVVPNTIKGFVQPSPDGTLLFHSQGRVMRVLKSKVWMGIQDSH
jgi:hypothetical protein